MAKPNRLPKDPKAILTPSPRPQKRLKTNHPSATEGHAPSTIKAQPGHASGTVQAFLGFKQPPVTVSTPQEALIPSSIMGPPPEILPPALALLQHKYALATMAVNSSSKINQKVRILISHMERFSFADLKAKPGLVILHAKADVASKMVSIVEIAKREVEKEKGRWWQYSGVTARLEELKAREKKKNDPGKVEGRTIKQWQEDPKSGGRKGKAVAEEVMNEAEAGPKARSEAQSTASAEEEEDDEAFQTMTKLGNVGNESKVRAVPIMSIYMARVPVPELKELYG